MKQNQIFLSSPCNWKSIIPNCTIFLFNGQHITSVRSAAGKSVLFLFPPLFLFSKCDIRIWIWMTLKWLYKGVQVTGFNENAGISSYVFRDRAGHCLPLLAGLKLNNPNKLSKLCYVHILHKNLWKQRYCVLHYKLFCLFNKVLIPTFHGNASLPGLAWF